MPSIFLANDVGAAAVLDGVARERVGLTQGLVNYSPQNTDTINITGNNFTNNSNSFSELLPKQQAVVINSGEWLSDNIQNYNALTGSFTNVGVAPYSGEVRIYVDNPGQAALLEAAVNGQGIIKFTNFFRDLNNWGSEFFDTDDLQTSAFFSVSQGDTISLRRDTGVNNTGNVRWIIIPYIWPQV